MRQKILSTYTVWANWQQCDSNNSCKSQLMGMPRAHSQ